MSFEKAFWAKVDRRGPDECWPWTGTDTGKGYGRLRWNGQNYQATHVALALDGRPVGAGRMALHHCDNPPCVNPAHLYVGTGADNVRDMLDRGRANRSSETSGRKADAARRVWAESSVEERQARASHIAASKTPTIRCETPLRLTGEPCYRIPNHGGAHRSKAGMLRRRG